MGFHNNNINWWELGSPTLTTVVRQYLKDRGISMAVARQANIRSLTPEVTEGIWNVPSEAMLTPFSASYGAARLFDVTDGKWRSTPGKPARLYEAHVDSIDWEEVRGNANEELLIVEGPIKALSAIAHGKTAVGITGCWNWQKDRQPIAGLLKYKWKGRTVTPVFDADVTDNNNVALPYLLLGDWLQAQGAKVLHVRIPRVGGRK